MENSKIILKSALRFIKKFALFVFVLWFDLVGIIHVILFCVFVAIITVFDFLTCGYNLDLTKQWWSDKMEKPKEIIKDLKNCLKNYMKQ